MPIVYLNFERMEIYEAGAVLLIHYLFPENSHSELQQEARLDALCGWALRIKAEKDPSTADIPQYIKPRYLIYPVEDVFKTLRRIETLLKQRAVAGKMAIPFVRRAETGNADLPAHMTQLSVNQMSEYVLDESGYSDQVNFENQVWRPSKPVLHIAATMQVLIQEKVKRLGQDLINSPQPFDMNDILLDRLLIEEIVDRAVLIEHLLLRSGIIKDESQMIKFRIQRPFSFQR